MRIKVREKRQVTLPAELLDALGVKPGDNLEAQVDDGKIILKPARKAVLDALMEISRALEAAGVTEEQLIADGKRIRADLAHERWPDIFPAPEPRA